MVSLLSITMLREYLKAKTTETDHSIQLICYLLEQSKAMALGHFVGGELQGAVILVTPPILPNAYIGHVGNYIVTSLWGNEFVPTSVILHGVMPYVLEVTRGDVDIFLHLSQHRLLSAALSCGFTEFIKESYVDGACIYHYNGG